MKHLKFAAFAALISSLFAAAPLTAGEPSADNRWEKTVFHIDEMLNARWALLLARAYLEDSPGARLAIVAYGPGVDFLLEGTNDPRGQPYDPAVLDLIEKGVVFSVCGTTLKARDIDPDTVLPGVKIVPSGITEIARLQIREGYAYLKP